MNVALWPGPQDGGGEAFGGGVGGGSFVGSEVGGRGGWVH